MWFIETMSAILDGINSGAARYFTTMVESGLAMKVLIFAAGLELIWILVDAIFEDDLAGAISNFIKYCIVVTICLGAIKNYKVIAEDISKMSDAMVQQTTGQDLKSVVANTIQKSMGPVLNDYSAKDPYSKDKPPESQDGK